MPKNNKLRSFIEKSENAVCVPCYEESSIENVVACQIPYEYKKVIWPNLPTNARGLFLGEKCELSTKNLNMNDITDTPGCLTPSDCELYSIIKTLK